MHFAENDIKGGPAEGGGSWRLMKGLAPQTSARARHCLLLACCIAGNTCIGNVSAASQWHPPDRLMHAVREIESGQGQFTYGDNGRSLGDFQLSEAAWIDVSAWRKSRDLPTYSYETHVWNPKVNRAYAADYLAILHGALKKRLNRPPTAAEVYASYNMGLSSFAQCQYRLTRVNSVTAKRCEQIKAALRVK